MFNSKINFLNSKSFLFVFIFIVLHTTNKYILSLGGLPILEIVYMGFVGFIIGRYVE